MSSPRVSVVRQADPKSLTQERWDFWYSDRSHALVLDAYRQMSRQTPRHKFTTTALYERITQNNPENWQVRLIKEEDVPLPMDVMDAAHHQFCDPLTVLKWTEAQQG